MLATAFPYFVALAATAAALPSGDAHTRCNPDERGYSLREVGARNTVVSLQRVCSLAVLMESGLENLA
jgi:hypothetical protein